MPSSARTSPSSWPAPRTGRRRTGTSRPATSSPRRCPTTWRPHPAVRTPSRSLVEAPRCTQYTEMLPELRLAADQFVQLVIAILDDAGINYLSVTGRAKSAGFVRGQGGPHRRRSCSSFDDPLRQITDQIGVRVDHLRPERRPGSGRPSRRPGRRPRRPRHGAGDGERGALRLRQPTPARRPRRRSRRRIRVRASPGVARRRSRSAPCCSTPGPSSSTTSATRAPSPTSTCPDLDRRFTLAAGLLELADREFSTIRERLRTGVAAADPEPDGDDPRISPRELAAFLAGQYADAGWSRTDHYAWISGLLLELGITSLAELADTLRSVDTESLTERMNYKYPPGAVRRLDDALLWVHGDAYIDASRQCGSGPRLAGQAGEDGRRRLTR